MVRPNIEEIANLFFQSILVSISIIIVTWLSLT